MVAHDLIRPGLMIIGDATGFTLNMGLVIRGMDLAADSALAAAEAIEKTFQTMDLGQQSVNQYRALLGESFVGKDVVTYAKAPAFLECSHMYRGCGKLTTKAFYGILNHDLAPRHHIHEVGLGALKASGLKLTQIIGDVLAGIRALRRDF